MILPKLVERFGRRARLRGVRYGSYPRGFLDLDAQRALRARAHRMPGLSSGARGVEELIQGCLGRRLDAALRVRREHRERFERRLGDSIWNLEFEKAYRLRGRRLWTHRGQSGRRARCTGR